MAEPISDGTVSWIGGMDTSRSPEEIGDIQYSRSVNTVIPRSLGGIKNRPGFVYQNLEFSNPEGEQILKKGKVLAEGWFCVGSRYFIVVVVDGVVFRLSPKTASSFYVDALNINDRNEPSVTETWVTRIPDGVIIQNGFNLPLIIKSNSIRRSKGRSEGEIGIGRMGIYVQNRYFYVDQSGRGIRISNFLNPIGETEAQLAGIDRFVAPENGDEITAIGKQKVMLDYVTGGALVFSTRINIYSIDVRGSLNEWALLNTRVGKVTQSIDGVSAISAYSFESFGSNLYFRNSSFGICDLRQSQYQFTQFDTTIHQSIEASYWLDKDTEFLLPTCYTRAWKTRLFTTVTPERLENGIIVWHGILSMSPDATYQDRAAAPRRFESVFTGLRTVAMTTVSVPNKRDRLYVWSYDSDQNNRLYLLDENLDHDINHRGQRVEIEGFIETRGFNFKSPFQQKKSQAIFYNTQLFPRSISLKFFARNQTAGQWTFYSEMDHLVKWVNREKGVFKPIPLKPQVRGPIYLALEDLRKCGGEAYITIQDRIEFKGPFHLSNFIRIANPDVPTRTVSKNETVPLALEFTYRPDYNYLISERSE